MNIYLLKEYNNRWFVYGKNVEYDNLINLALDRLISIDDSTESYETNAIDFDDYFEDVLGVSINLEQDPEKIVLRIDIAQWPYINTKPIHGSQKVISREEDYIDISLELIVNYELEAQIFQFGESVEVLKPQNLREKIKNRAKTLFNKYI